MSKEIVESLKGLLDVPVKDIADAISNLISEYSPLIVEPPTSPVTLSDIGLNFLIEVEGSREKMYYDVAGYPTIGVGHLLTKDELDSGMIYLDGEQIPWPAGLTEAEIKSLLLQDVDIYAKAVAKHVTVPLSQNQFDALTSFTFNLGSGALKRSTLLKVLNRGKYQEVPAQLSRWNKAGGKVVQGLVNRRNKEIKLWNNQWR